ncbi:MAG: hypothetical protein HXX15_17740 [Rhodopseudomonas sp.]|uniref:hypothetical protein n=1 Tax=Rhodopseudomonas sp. TaxID=1078 RepID=UPI0018007062|nr:hypothetical protein [Rhodopseudomonas sp.]NVN87924.1 hypothetical protein [Rhodopseudomonas sp.]
MKALPLLKVLGLGFVAIAGAIAPAMANDLIINNTSKYDLHELYVSKSKSSEWGPDQLRKDTVAAGKKFTLHNLSDGTYDLKVVDEDGTECTIEDAAFDESKEWTITSKMLERCDKFGN